MLKKYTKKEKKIKEENKKKSIVPRYIIFLILSIILGGIFTALTSYAATIAASNISYDNTTSGLSATNAQDALDALYNSFNTEKSKPELGDTIYIQNYPLSNTYKTGTNIFSRCSLVVSRSFKVVYEYNGSTWAEAGYIKCDKNTSYSPSKSSNKYFITSELSKIYTSLPEHTKGENPYGTISNSRFYTSIATGWPKYEYNSTKDRFQVSNWGINSGTGLMGSSTKGTIFMYLQERPYTSNTCISTGATDCYTFKLISLYTSEGTNFIEFYKDSSNYWNINISKLSSSVYFPLMVYVRTSDLTWTASQKYWFYKYEE